MPSQQLCIDEENQTSGFQLVDSSSTSSSSITSSDDLRHRPLSIATHYRKDDSVHRISTMKPTMVTSCHSCHEVEVNAKEIQISGSNATIEEDNNNHMLPFQSSSSCPICLENYSVCDVLCWSRHEACSHCFHEDCLVAWLLKHDLCPICRSDYLNEHRKGY